MEDGVLVVVVDVFWCAWGCPVVAVGLAVAAEVLLMFNLFVRVFVVIKLALPL